MVRLTLGLPFSVSSASRSVLSLDSLRMPTLSALLVGTRSVIRSFSKRSTYSSSCMPAISWLLQLDHTADAVLGVNDIIADIEGQRLGSHVLSLSVNHAAPIGCGRGSHDRTGAASGEAAVRADLLTVSRGERPSASVGRLI